jgi:hypothetical protein
MDKMETQQKPRFDTEQIPDAGAERSRIERSSLRGSWHWNLDTIQQELNVYSDDERGTLIEAFRWCVDPEHPIHLKDFARRVKSSDNTLYKIYTGRYRYQDEIIERKDGEEIRKPHPKAGQPVPLQEGLIKNIDNFLAIEKRRVALGNTKLVKTPLVKKITDYCNLIRELKLMGWIVGGSHIGKSWALEFDYTPSNNHGRTIYCRLPAGAGRREVFGAIWKAMSNSSTKGSVDELKGKIQNALTKDMLLILDEIHLLHHHARPGTFFKILDEIREMHDRKKCGVIMVFTWLPEDMKAAQDKQLQQVFRRAPRKLYLPKMPAMEDVEAILEHNGLSFPGAQDVVTVKFDTVDAQGNAKKETIQEKPYELLRQIAKNEALLAITERIRAGQVIAKAKRKEFAWEHFVEAHLEIAAEGDPKNQDEGWV